MANTTIDNSHKTILKSTGVFGMMQIMKMFISIVGSKFVAVFLGPVGIGTVGLLNNTLMILTSISSFGITTTSVREIAIADKDTDKIKLKETIYIIQRITFAIGLFGAFIAILFSSLLSRWTFGSTNYYHWFILLSINFLITSYTSACVAILQGKRMLKIIAVSNVVSSIVITLTTVLIYYFYRFEGIVPVILVSSAIHMGVNIYFTRSFKTTGIHFNFSEIYQKSLPILKLGLLLSINVIFGHICTFLIKVYLNGNGATTQILGFYEVSTVVLISYVGMIFSSMSIDFYPRLTSINQDNLSVKELVNNQLEIGLLIITPAIILLYLIAPFVIQLLYTKEFLPVVLIFKAALFSIIIKAIIWPLGFIILAKGNKKQYFKQELVGDFLNVSLTILLYHSFGLIGIGVATVINFSLYGFYVYSIVHKKYDFSFRRDTSKIIIFSICCGVVCCVSNFCIDEFYFRIIAGGIFSVSIGYSYFTLDKLISFKFYINKFRNKISGNQ
jgi:O-antigen/teichoic acid export membrane protein